MPYTRRNWQNAPSSATPLNAAALNNIEDGVEAAYDAVTGRLSEPSLAGTIGGVGAPVDGAIPAGLGWDEVNYPLTLSLRDAFGPVSVVGDIGMTPEALFNANATVLTAPGATFYVTTAGSDAANGLTEGTAFRSLYKAIQAANAAAVPTRINVQAGTYERLRSFYYVAVTPSVDIALVAYGGRVDTGTFDLFTSASPDGTYPNCYTVSVANCDSVVDTASRNEFGDFRQLINVGSAAACNSVPGSWFLTGSTLYIHRADEKSITPANTRVFRNQPSNLLINQAINVYLGGNGTGSGWDFSGGPGNAVASFTTGVTTARKIAVIADSTFKYGGGSIGTATVGLGVNSWNGLFAAFNCAANANATDGINIHNGNSITKPLVLLVNCAGEDNGRGTALSCQGLTIHEDVKLIDVAGFYRKNRGGNIRNIDTSKMYAYGTLSKDDQGDFANGGGVRPTGIRIDGSSTLWAERVKVDMPRGQHSYVTGDGTAIIRRRNCLSVPQPDYGPGTFTTY